MRKLNFKLKNNSIKWFVALLLTGLIIFAALPAKINAESSYKTNFDWQNDEEAQHEWPMEDGLTKTNTGIGTAGFSYQNYYYNDDNRIVLEFELSMFPKSPNQVSSAFRSFREQWLYANIFVDPNLATMVDDTASFFMMSYPADSTSVSLNQAISKTGTVYKLSVDQVYPKMPTSSDYMKSKLYLVLNDGVKREDLDEDYAMELRYTNDNNQVYNQTGSSGRVVLGDYNGYNGISNYDAGENNDDVTLKTIAPFHTASMTNVLPNPYLPPDMMRTVGQSVIYDNINGKLHVYYKQAPNHYIYTNSYANNGYFLSSWIGIRQVMDSRIYDALKPDTNGVVGQMRMMDLNGIAGNWSVPTDIKHNEFSEIKVDENVSTYSYMMIPSDFKTDIADKAIVPENQTNNVKNVYLHGYNKEADYVRFIYNVDKNKMDALFKEANNSNNSSTFSISTSYITDRPEDKIQTEYRLTPNTDIVIPKGAMIIFDLPKDSRSVFKAGLANNYERLIGNLKTRRPGEMNLGVDPRDYGEGYTITPYIATQGGFVLTSEAGLKIPSGDTIRLVMFDDTSPETVKMTVATGMHGVNRTDYYLTKQPESVNKNNIYTMANANVRSGIIINRSANTPHIDEFFTDNTAITGHSKYPNAFVSARKAADNLVFKEANSSTTPKNFTAEGETHYIVEGEQHEYSGYAFTLDLPGDIDLKKDMALSFSNAAAGYFRSVPVTYRTQARVTFDKNGGAGESVKRNVPINQKAYGEEGYSPNGFEGPNILWLDAQGNDAQATTITKYFSDYEGLPITDTDSQAHKDRLFYGKKGDSDAPAREGYTFLGWSTKQVDSMSLSDFTAMSELTDVSEWSNEETNYKFTANSPVDESRTVYAVWEKKLDTYRIVLHANTGGTEDITHIVDLPLADITDGNTGKLTAYLKEPGNVLFDAGFVKAGHYFVGWSETDTVLDGTKVHELYTNESKAKINGEGKFQLQLNEEPKEPVEHINPWKTTLIQPANENGIATLNLYAQYKPLINMTGTKNWYDKEAKAAYENHVNDPITYPTPPNPKENPDFPNSDVAMVLLRTTEGKTLDPTKYEIVRGFYVQGTENGWQWAPQEGHDPNGRKYSYLMTEFNAQGEDAHDEEAIINHFNTHRTWASIYITMVGQSDLLSKYTAISFEKDGNIKPYMAVATSNQPGISQQDVNTSESLEFNLKNFEVDVLPAIINRIQTNHTEIKIDKPTDDARYLYIKLDANSGHVLFFNNNSTWKLHNTNPNAAIDIREENNKLIISSKTEQALDFENRAGDKVYALFSLNNPPTPPALDKYAWRIIQAYNALPNLVEVKQEPHVKDENGNITHNVITAKIPAGTYVGADYTLGYMVGDSFKAVTDSEGNPITVKPDANAKLTFNVPAGKLNGNTSYIIRGVDPADTHSPSSSNVPNLDLTAPTISASNFEILTGDLIEDEQGLVTVTDVSSVTLSYSVKKDNLDVTLPEGITFDPITGKFSGKTADTLPTAQLGAYSITIKAEDIYGNVSSKYITLTITQKPTTVAITSITQKANDAQGNAVLTVQGLKDATIKLYSEDAGTYTEIGIPGTSGSEITNEDGTIDITISQADVSRFNGKKVYVTQQMLNELESNKVDATGEIINRAENKQISTGGAIVIDNVPPTPLQMVQPKEQSTTLKITNLSADEHSSNVQDIDKIDLKIGTNIECTLVRDYDHEGNPTNKWLSDGREFYETVENVEFVINPNTGETEPRSVGILNYSLPAGTELEAFQSIEATYYDYLGNVSATVTTSVLELPKPIAPYDMTAMNDSVAHPGNTVIKGKADPGAQVSITIVTETNVTITYSVIADEDSGEFTLAILKQVADTELTVTSTLNRYTATGTVTVKDKVVKTNPDDDSYVEVDFNAGAKGTFATGSTTKYWVLKDQTVKLTAPGIDSNPGWPFTGWDPAVETRSYSENTTHTAQYGFNGGDVVAQTQVGGENKPDVPENYVEVKFLPGDHGSITGTSIYWVNPAKEVTLPQPSGTVDQDYKFTGWDKELTGTFDKATTITAQYKKKVLTDVTTDEDYVKVDFSAGDHGSLAETKEYWVLIGEAVNLTAPGINPNTGWELTSWNPVLEIRSYNGPTTHTARYTYIGDKVVGQTQAGEENKPDVPGNYVEVKFLAGENGTIGQEQITIYWVDPTVAVTVPAPTVSANPDYKHAGWNPPNLTGTFATATEITAQYKKKVVTTNPDDPDYVKVNFDPGTGLPFASGSTTEFWVLKNESVTITPPIPNPQTNRFFAQWDPAIAISYSEDETHYARYFDGQEGVVVQQGDTKPPTVPDTYKKVEFTTDTKGNLAGITTYWVNPTASVKLMAPSVTANADYKFIDWDPTVPTDPTTYTNNQTYEARYKKKVLTEVTADPEYVKVEFNKGAHGNFAANATTEYWVLINETVSLEVPTGTTNPGWTFAGWDQPVATSYSGNTIHTAQYNYTGSDVVAQTGTVEPDLPDTFVKVEFKNDTGGRGTIDLGQTTIYWVNRDTEVTVPAPSVTVTDDEYKFTGWDPVVATSYSIDTEHTALYKKKVVTDESVSTDTDYVKVDFSAETNGTISAGTSAYWVLKEEIVTVTPPTVTANPDWTFTGWDSVIATSYSGPKTYKAEYTYKGQNVVGQADGAGKPNVPDTFVKVEFKDSTGGTIDQGQTKTYWVNPTVEVTVPAPTVSASEGFKHTGWNPGLTGTFTTATEITAQYKAFVVSEEPQIDDPENPGTPITDPAYVKVEFSAEGKGSFEEGSKTRYWVLKGEIVTLTAPSLIENEGYEFMLWDHGFTAASFEMPTTIKAQYKSIVTKDDPADPDYYVKVDFSAEGKGSFALTETTTYWVLINAEVNLTPPTVQPSTGWKFTEWNPAVKTKYGDGENTTHKAQYTYEGDDVVGQPGSIKPVVPDDFVEVKFLPGTNGRIDEGQTTIYWVNPAALDISDTLQAPVVSAKEGYKFTGWDPVVATSYSIGTEHTAQYKEKVVKADPKDEAYVKVDFNAGAHGTFAPDEITSYWVLKNVTVTLTAPSVNVNEDYDFTGWDTELTGTFVKATVITAQYEVKETTAAPVLDLVMAGDTKITGTAPAYSEVTVKVKGKDYNVTADGDGKWTVNLMPEGSTLTEGDIIKATAQEAGKIVSPTVQETVSNYKDKYDPTVTDITKIYGQATTEAEVTGAVHVPGYPEGIEQPVVSLGENAVLPDGNTPGVYNIPAIVTYPDGTTDTVTVKIKINAPPENETPAINKLKAGDTSVSGTAEPGAKIKVELPNGKTKETTADAEGNWKVVTDQPLVEGQEVGAIAITEGKAPSDKATTMVGPAPVLQTASPNITKPKAGDTSVSGTAEPGATVVITLPNNTTVNANADADGKWTVATGQPLVEGQEVGATATKEGKDPSDNVTTIVGSAPVLQTASPTINKPVAGDTNVKGTAEPGATVTVKLPSGTETVTADSITGAWQVTTGPLQVNDTIEATATANGKDPSNKVIATVGPAPAQIEQTANPVITKPKAGDTNVSGTAEPGATVVVKLPNGTIETLTADSVTGAWQVTTDPLQANDTIEATATATDKDPSNKVTTTVGPADPAPLEQTANPVITKPKAGDTIVSGTAEPGATVTVKLPNGTIETVTADSVTGAWQVTTDPLQANDTIEATATATDKDPSNKVIATVGPAPLEQTANPVITKPKAGDTSVSGTAEPGATVTVKLPNGTTKTLTADSVTGAWQVTTDPLQANDTIEATATANGKDPSNKVIATVGPADPAPLEQTANPVITKPKVGDTSVSGTAEPGAKVVVELPDGTTKETTADADGNWKVVFAKPLAEGDTVGATATKQGKDPSNKVITTVGSAPLGQTTNPRIIKPKAGDTSVSGTAEPGATVVVTLPDGTTKEITADANGNWKVVFAKPLEEGQEVGVTATKEGKDSSNKVITTVGPADPAPVEQTANPTINKPVAGDTSVSGTAEPGAKVVVELPDGTTKETIADADGKWTVASNQPLAEGQVIVVTATTDGKAPSDKVITTVGPKDPTQTVDPTDPTQTDHTDPTQPKPTDPTQPEPKDPGTLGKVIPVGSDIDSPIPENYIRLYFDPTGNGWLKYNPTFDTGTVIAFDALKNITWADALANGLIVPTATHNDPALTFDKWSLTMSGDTVINNTTHRYYYFVASYKPVKPTTKVTTTPAGTTDLTTPTKDGISPVVRTGESTSYIMIAIVFILLGAILMITRRKVKQDKK